MSAFGTKKPGGSFAAQLTFPTVFQEAYQTLGAKPRFQPATMVGSMRLSEGDGFQEGWHEQKKADADRMVRAKVQSTHNMNNRAQTAVHNMPSQPKPVLGQRKYANNSHGAVGGGITREDYDGAPFHFSDAISGGGRRGAPLANMALVGGVLRTAQGQSYGNTILQARIGQLNAISQAKMAFESQGSVPFSETAPFRGSEPSSGLEVVPQVELANLLQSINDSLSHNFFAGEPSESQSEGGIGRFTYSDTTKAFALIVRLASTGSEEEIADVLEYVNGSSADDGILPKLAALTIRPIQPATNFRTQEIYLSLKDFWERIKIYLEKMIKLVGQPEQNRRNASKALIKSLKFSKMRSSMRPDDMINVQDAQQAVDDQSTDYPGGRWTDTSSRSSGPSRGFDRRGTSETSSTYEQRRAEMGSQMTGHRTPHSRQSVATSRGYEYSPLLRREDSQHGYRGQGAEFDADERNTFAYNSGEIDTGGRPVGWATAEAAEYGEPAWDNSEVAQRIEGMEGAVNEEGESESDQEGRSPPARVTSPRLRSGRNEFGDWDVSPPKFVSPVGAAPVARPDFLQSRSDLPNTLSGFRLLAPRINEFYDNNLPDGKGPIKAGIGELKNIRANFIRRLML